MPKSPYEGLPPDRFWKTGVVEQSATRIAGVYTKKFAIGRSEQIATAGSCFAQHIARQMRARGFAVMDLEPAPPGLDAAAAGRYGYGLFSARYANIYVVRQLLQLAKEAFGLHTPSDAIWERDGRYFDALRPSVEPNGLETPELVRVHRAHHLEHVRALFTSVDLLVFTLGLTESWVHRASGTVYPTAPGTLAGTFDPELHAFVNFAYDEILADFLELKALLQAHRPGLRFLLTVSPVPLTATAAERHVLVSSTYSKGVLRAVAGRLADTHADIDYFPSFEIITSPLSQGRFYESNLRSVKDEGVEAVMDTFFAEHGASEDERAERGAARRGAAKRGKTGRGGKGKRRPGKKKRRLGKGNRRAAGAQGEEASEDTVCEEALLEAFGK